MAYENAQSWKSHAHNSSHEKLLENTSMGQYIQNRDGLVRSCAVATTT